MSLLGTIVRTAIDPALALLPAKMDTPAARVQLLAIGLQESRFQYRRQLGNGPARGLWQFERTGGVRGVLTHPASREHAYRICGVRGVAPVAAAVHPALETDDMLAAAFARLLMWTDGWRLPAVGDVQGAWDMYIRTWRPGKPHPQTWGGLYAQAVAEVGVEMLSWLERFKGWLVLAGLALAALASVFYRGRATGRQAERQERQDQINEQAAKARQEVRNVQLETARMDDDAVADELERDWVRGSGPRGR